MTRKDLIDLSFLGGVTPKPPLLAALEGFIVRVRMRVTVGSKADSSRCVRWRFMHGWMSLRAGENGGGGRCCGLKC